MKDFLLKLLGGVRKEKYDTLAAQYEALDNSYEELNRQKEALYKEVQNYKVNTAIYTDKISALEKQLEDYDKVCKELEEAKEALKMVDSGYETIIKKNKELQEKLDAAQKQLDEIVELSVKKNDGDKVILNGQEFGGDNIKFIKGDPVEISIYDKDDKLYPNLELDEK